MAVDGGPARDAGPGTPSHNHAPAARRAKLLPAEDQLVSSEVRCLARLCDSFIFSFPSGLTAQPLPQLFHASASDVELHFRAFLLQSR